MKIVMDYLVSLNLSARAFNCAYRLVRATGCASISEFKSCLYELLNGERNIDCCGVLTKKELAEKIR